MAELGQASESAHVEAGQLAAGLGLNGLIAVGRWADTTVRAAQEAGLANVAAFDDVTVAGKALAKNWNRATRCSSRAAARRKLRASSRCFRRP